MLMDNPVSLGKALRLLRTRQRQTQTVIADTAGITKAMFSSYERGVHLPSIPSLFALLNALNGDLYDLQDVLDEVEGLPPRRKGMGSPRSR